MCSIYRTLMRSINVFGEPIYDTVLVRDSVRIFTLPVDADHDTLPAGKVSSDLYISAYFDGDEDVKQWDIVIIDSVSYEIVRLYNYETHYEAVLHKT